MRKAVIRDRATHDLVSSSLGKGPQVFGKVLCKSERNNIAKNIILLVKTWRLSAQEGCFIIELFLSPLTLIQVSVGHNSILYGLFLLLAPLTGTQELATLNKHSFGALG